MGSTPEWTPMNGVNAGGTDNVINEQPKRQEIGRTEPTATPGLDPEDDCTCCCCLLCCLSAASDAYTSDDNNDADCDCCTCDS